MVLLQKLVESPLFQVAKIPLNYIKDIFNAIGDRLEHWKDIKNQDNLITLLYAGSMISANNLSQEKVDNSNSLNEIIQTSEDIRVIIYASEILQQVGINVKRASGNFPNQSIFLSEIADKVVFLSVAHNLLRQPENHYTLLDTAKGKNKNGESFSAGDLIFDIHVEPQGLNDKTTTKSITISRDTIMDKAKSAHELAKEIAGQNGKDSEPYFRSKLEAKIIWLRFLKDEETAKLWTQLLLNIISSAYSFKSDIRHQEFTSYLKDNYMKETLEILTTLNDKVNNKIQPLQDLLIKLLANMFKLLTKDQAQLITLDSLIILDRLNPGVESEEKSLFFKILEDFSCLRLQEENSTFIKNGFTQTISLDVMKSSMFQFYLTNLLYFIIKIINSVHNRQSVNYNQFTNKIIETIIKVLDDCPEDKLVYIYNPKVTFMVCQILRYVARPRNEEQFQVIKCVEKRLIFEIENLDKDFQLSLDEQNVGISRRVQETQILQTLVKAFSYNTEEGAHLVDDFLPKYVTLIGQVCSDSPASTPNLIKNGIYEAILVGVKQRVPAGNEAFESLIFSINQMSLHEEGQKLIQESGIFNIILDKIYDDKFSFQQQSELMGLKIHLSNLFDRNPIFKETAKAKAEEFINKLKEFGIEQTKAYFTILRAEGQTNKEKSEAINNSIKKSKEYQRMLNAITFINLTANLQSDHRGQLSRHTQDIYTEPIFNNLMDLFEIIGSNPALVEFQQILQRCLKPLVEVQQFAQNVNQFITKFKTLTDQFVDMFPTKLHQADKFDFENKENYKEQILPLEQLNLAEASNYLSKGEMLIIKTSLLYSFTKTQQYLHSSTQHQMIQNENVLKIAKIIYRVLRIVQKVKQNIFSEVYIKSRSIEESEENTKYSKLWAMTHKEYMDLQGEDKKNMAIKMREIFNNAITERFNEQFPPELRIRDIVFFDYLAKISQLSFHQNRHQPLRDNLEKNLKFIGKILSKTTKQINQRSLENVKIDTESNEFVKTLYSIDMIMNEITIDANKGLLDGASFYQFYKERGLHNILECYNWLTKIELTESHSAALVHLYDETCKVFKDFLTIMINSRQADNHINSILTLSMEGEFDSPKHFYQNVYHCLCTGLLPFNSEEKFNPIIKSMNKRNTYLTDVILLLLQNASKSFNNCQFVKDGQVRREEREGRRGGRGQADPGLTQQLLDMGMGTRERISQALVQAQNNFEAALNLLMQQNFLESNNVVLPDDGQLSSDQSFEGESAFNLEGNLPQAQKQKLEKIKEEQFTEVVKKTQQEGFNWMVEAQKYEEIQSQKFKEYFYTVMVSEKIPDIQAHMFTQIEAVFDINLQKLQQEIATLSPDDLEKEEKQKVLTKVQSDLNLIQRLINHSKVYLKEALRRRVFDKCQKLLQEVVTVMLKPQMDNQIMNKMLFDLLYISFTFVQLLLLQVNVYQNQLQKVPQQESTIKKKIKSYKENVPTNGLFDMCLKIMNTILERFEREGQKLIQHKKYIGIITSTLAFRILQDKEMETDLKSEGIRNLFQVFLKLRKFLMIDNRILQSLSLLTFESDSLIQTQAEKLTQKVMWLKYEYESKGIPADSKDQGHLLAKSGFNNFLNYFSALSSKNQDIFKKVLTDFFELKSVKRAEKFSQDQAVIRLKESIFNDTKKSVQKERATFKQIQKIIDLKNPVLKGQVKTSKKLLMQQIPEEQKKFLNDYITLISQRTQEFLEGFEEFTKLQSEENKYVLPKDQVAKHTFDDTALFETIFKLSQAYPAYTGVLSQYTNNSKRSFVNWFIKDYLSTKTLQRHFKDAQNEEIEITYSFKQDFKTIDVFCNKYLNCLTGYNHLMTLNEQVVKHELRTKFVTEALAILQKTIKDKSIHQWKQKAIIISCLTVVNSLINYQVNSQQKIQTVSVDNYHNSIRSCILRDASQKENLPNSFIKIVNDLINDVIDVSLPSNSEIINKCVTILKVFAEFITQEKKKEEQSKQNANKSSIKEEAKLPQLQEEDVDMMEQEQIQIQPVQPFNQMESDSDEEMEVLQQEVEEEGEENEEMEDEDEEEDNIEEIEGDEEENLFEQEEEMDDAIELQRQEADHDMFEEDEGDSALDDEEIMEDDHFGGAQRNRQQRPLDIINLNDREPIHMGINAVPQRRNYQEPRRQDWSQEEAEVQRILSNMRASQELIGRPAAALANPLDQQKRGLIEEIFSGLKLVTDKELFEIAAQQKQAFDMEIKDQQGKNQNERQFQDHPNANPFRQHLLAARFGLDENEDFLNEFEALGIQERGGFERFMNHERLVNLQAILGNMGHNPPGGLNAILDPMFLRPNNQLLLDPGQPMAIPNDQLDIGAYSIQLRNDFQRNQNNAVESLGLQLIETMEKQVEEEKVDLNKKPSLAESGEKTNEQLLEAFLSMANPLAPGQERNSVERIGERGELQRQRSSSPRILASAINEEMEQERRRIEQRSRELRELQEQQDQEILNIVRQQEQIQQQQQQQQQQNEQQPSQYQQEQLQQQQIIGMDIQPPEFQQVQSLQLEIAQQEIQQPVAELDQQQQQMVIEEGNLQVIEEQKQEQPNEEQKQQVEEVKQEQNQSSGKTFGYDNEVLIAAGIDPEILHELPEDLRAELLSSIELPPEMNMQQPAAQEEQKLPEGGQQQQQQQQQQQPAAQQQQQPEYYALAQELGLDPEFLANLPEDMRMELIEQAQANLAPPQRQPEQMDIASFIATVNDPSLRREIFMNMDEATLNSLPPNLMAEARRVQDQIRYDRVRARELHENLDRRARGIFDGLNAPGERDDPYAAIFGRGRPGRPGAPGEQLQQHNGGKGLDEAVNARQNELSNECTNDDILNSLTQQMATDEKILESLLLILLSNNKVNCELIPCLNSLIKIQNSNGILVLRNKFINAITFILKSITNDDDESLKLLFPNCTLTKKQSALILIGCLRILLKSNKNLMKYILKGLIIREDNQIQHVKSTQILKKQMKAMSLKSPQNVEMSSLDESSAEQKKPQALNIVPPLAEIFSLIRQDMFKKDKVLIRNLSLLIHQILKQFDIALDELENSNQAISLETIQSIADILSLDIIDQQLLQDLGEFLYQISKRKKANFDLISSFCKQKCLYLIKNLSDKLSDFHFIFEQVKLTISPSKILNLNLHQSPSQTSAFEEEKSEHMIIDTSISQQASNQVKNTVKLPEEDEKKLKANLKIQEDSEVLLRILKLFSLFYDKFNEQKDGGDKHDNEENKEEQIQTSDVTQTKEVVEFIQSTYQQNDLKFFIERVSDTLKIIYRTNIDITEGISNLIFCVFSTYYPELFESVKNEAIAASNEVAGEGKYRVKMLPLNESVEKPDKFMLFRNAQYFTNRINELTEFCFANKRIINKLIKSKPNLFQNEIEGLVKHMPNLLDFDNKRTFFKKELTKMKKSQFYDQIQLFIRRDDIFMDSYAQLGIRTAAEMKGRLHIQFTGERGQDAGGLTRDFFIELSREMFNPNYSLFNLSSSGSTYYPNPKSDIERDHLRYFKFIGRVIGKALFDECLLECYFVKSLYKIITGEPLLFSDLEDFDNEFYNNLKWCLDNDVEPLMATFVVEQEYFGRSKEVELIPNGKNTPVSNENKKEYVEKLTFYKLYKSIQQQTDAFLEGFYELIPKDLISVFNYKELELLISGLPNFDSKIILSFTIIFLVTDLKNNTEYQGYSPNSPQVIWLWEVLETFENSDRAELLQFVTGSSKVPLDGFKGLMGMRGPQKFTIAKIKSDDIMRLPSGHTWQELIRNQYKYSFNQLDLPEYPTKEILHERVLTAIKETKGFGFA